VLSILKTVLVVALVYGIYWLAKTNWGKDIPMPKLAVNALVFAAVGFAVDAFLGFSVSKFAEYRSFFLKKLLAAFGSIFVMVIFWLYLVVLNPVYLRWGKIENLRRTSRWSMMKTRVMDFLF